MTMSLEEPDPAARLQKVKATTTEVKTSPTAGLQYLMQTHIMPHLPLWMCREMVHNALATHTVVSHSIVFLGPGGAVVRGCTTVVFSLNIAKGAPLLPMPFSFFNVEKHTTMRRGAPDTFCLDEYLTNDAGGFSPAGGVLYHVS